MGSLATLPALAAKIVEWFPELEGRAVAVADAEVNKQNVPTMPVCMVALINAPPSALSTKRRPAVTENIAIEFWFSPVRNKRADGSESPFYAFYDYDKLMRALLPRMARYTSPSNSQFKYAGMDVEATPLAVIVQFVYTHEMYICGEDDEPDDTGDGHALDICVSFTDT